MNPEFNQHLVAAHQSQLLAEAAAVRLAATAKANREESPVNAPATRWHFSVRRLVAVFGALRRAAVHRVAVH